MIPGFQELIHMRKDTTFAASLRKKETGNNLWYDSSNVNQLKMIEDVLERNKLEVKTLLKDNLKRIVTFDDSNELVSKLSAEQRVENVIKKLRSRELDHLAELVQFKKKGSNLYAPRSIQKHRDQRV